MKYSFSYLVCILVTTHLFGQVSDTVFLLKENTAGIYHAIFIDGNKQSIYYNQIADFNFDESDRETYADYLNYLKENDIQLIQQSIKGIPRKWILIKQYRNKFYAYKPSDFMYHYKVNITDTSFIDYGSEGMSVRKIENFTRLGKGTYKFRLTGVNAKDQELTIHVIDKRRGIAIFSEGDYNYLMIPEQNITDVPIVVNYCEKQKQMEFDFDEPDYSRLLERNRK